ncbi:hypothetical protein HanXRQr2_Chr16g0770241 [Helianthus annuus]|uniref:Uncharacterized protein n=1 Tax=Helianthus annuus TaxID=4232 RepID=A0A9K3DWL4_HELAN|nr:hypothetical protein HanXRQr2_Chr16g0770241 [Helianthus annuus]KAJ0822975.1 hypothetical protein HanPSC8_Chr16g0738311 [Helianthus annuus]
MIKQPQKSDLRKTITIQVKKNSNFTYQQSAHQVFDELSERKTATKSDLD